MLPYLKDEFVARLESKLFHDPPWNRDLVLGAQSCGGQLYHFTALPAEILTLWQPEGELSEEQLW